MRDAEERTVRDSRGQHTANFRTLTLTLTPTSGPPVVTHFAGLLEALTAWRRLTGAQARPRWAPRDRPTAARALARRPARTFERRAERFL